MTQTTTDTPGPAPPAKTKGKPRGRPRGSGSKRAATKKAQPVPSTAPTVDAPVQADMTVLEKTPATPDDFVLIEPQDVAAKVTKKTAIESMASEATTDPTPGQAQQPTEPRYTRSELSAYAREAVERLERRWQHRLKQRLGLWRYLLPPIFRQSPFGLSNARRTR